MFKELIAKLMDRDLTLTYPRSPKWNTVRKKFLIDNGAQCSCCGRTKDLNVHHIIPIHIDPSLELENANLIILCEKPCHIYIGHNGSWVAYNPHVIEDSIFWNKRIKERKYK